MDVLLLLAAAAGWATIDIVHYCMLYKFRGPLYKRASQAYTAELPDKHIHTDQHPAHAHTLYTNCAFFYRDYLYKKTERQRK